MTNILYVIWSLGLGGAEQVVIHLARGLDKSRFRPSIACLNDEGKFADALQNEGIAVFPLNKGRGLDFSVLGKLARIIKENDIHIVHSHLWGGNFWGRIAALRTGIPAVITEHNIDVWKSPFHFLIDRMLLKKTACFIAVSNEVRYFYAARLGVEKEKITVIYNGIDINTSPLRPCSGQAGHPFDSAQGRQVTPSTPLRAGRSPEQTLKQEFGIGEDEKVIAVIGRIVPVKGHAFFLDALEKMMDERRKMRHGSQEVKALIVGDGPLLQSLKLKTSQNQTLKDKVLFTGLRKDVADILEMTDIFVLPSSREGLPLTVLEAMAAGAVVVATRVGGTPEIVEDNVNGFLVEYGDTQGLRQKMEHVLDNLEKLEPVRDAAGKTVRERFGLPRMIAEHEKVYAALTAGHV